MKKIITIILTLAVALSGIAVQTNKATVEVKAADGYDENGYDEEGYDKYGFDRDGYNREGYDKYGFGRDGYNKNGVQADYCWRYPA